MVSKIDNEMALKNKNISLIITILSEREQNLGALLLIRPGLFLKMLHIFKKKKPYEYYLNEELGSFLKLIFDFLTSFYTLNEKQNIMYSMESISFLIEYSIHFLNIRLFELDSSILTFLFNLFVYLGDAEFEVKPIKKENTFISANNVLINNLIDNPFKYNIELLNKLEKNILKLEVNKHDQVLLPIIIDLQVLINGQFGYRFDICSYLKVKDLLKNNIYKLDCLVLSSYFEEMLISLPNDLLRKELIEIAFLCYEYKNLTGSDLHKLIYIASTKTSLSFSSTHFLIDCIRKLFNLLTDLEFLQYITESLYALKISPADDAELFCRLIEKLLLGITTMNGSDLINIVLLVNNIITCFYSMSDLIILYDYDKDIINALFNKKAIFDLENVNEYEDVMYKTLNIIIKSLSEFQSKSIEENLFNYCKNFETIYYELISKQVHIDNRYHFDKDYISHKHLIYQEQVLFLEDQDKLSSLVDIYK